MGFLDRLRKTGDYVASDHHADGAKELHVGDASYDDWEVVRDFGELETARAFRQVLTERGIESVLTSDYPLDEYGRADIALRVRKGSWSDAEDALDDDPDT